MKIEGIKKVMVITGPGYMDKLCIDVDWPSPFPNNEDPVSLTIDTPYGASVEYAALIGLEVDEVIQRGGERSKFSKS